MDKLVALETFLPWQQANCAITLLCESILSSYFAHMFLGTKHITGVHCCYGNTVPDMLLRIIHISALSSYCGNTPTCQNQMLTSRGNSPVRTISSISISSKRSFFQMNTTTLCSIFGDLVLCTHSTVLSSTVYIVQGLEGLQHLSDP